MSIHVGRISRFGHEHAAAAVEKVEYIAELIAGAAGDEDLIIGELNATLLIIAGYCAPEKRSSAFRHISVESVLI
jgi:hypothetical protein